jgi:hypothetical protein
MPNYNFDMSQIDLGSGADIDGFLSSPSNEDGGIYATSSILQTVMPSTSAQDFEINSIQGQPAPGIDALFAQQPRLVEAKKGRRMVASVSDLKSFTRISAESLIHKSEHDLWALKREGTQFFIERLFDDNGEPLKG